VLQRLRLAASSEGAGGRARAALVVALVRAGDLEGARGEVARLEAGAASHPLVPPLRAYVERSKGAQGPAITSVEDGGAAGVDVSSLKALGGGAPTDPRVLVSQAEIARSHGKLDVAKRLYELALQKNPTDSEALTGLAHVAHAQRDVSTAKDAYKRALAQNPSYVPALVGLADVEWESGDRASAQKSYREIVERFPESAYPMRVKVRADGQGPAAPQASSSAPTPTAPVPTASAPPTDTPPQAPSAPPTPTPAPKPEEPSP
jgi:tetratricopeptide (TPR) repeat protein